MINLRYHIVSITAVFLALAIGLALGSTLIQRGIVDTLETRLDELGERLDRTDGENADLRDEIEDRDDFDQRLAEARDPLLAGHLADRSVLMLAVQGTDSDTLDQVRQSLRSAGAVVSGTLVFTARWERLSDDEIAELAVLLDRRISSEGVARSVTLRRVAEQLAAASEPAPNPEPELDPDALDGLDSLEGLEGLDGPVAPGQTTPGDTDDGSGPGQTPSDETVDPPGGSDGNGDGDGEGEGEGETPLDEPTPETDLIDALITLGYLEFFPESAATPLPRYETSYLLISDDEAALPDSQVTLPLLEQLVGQGAGTAPIVVAGRLGPEPETEDPDEVDLSERLTNLIRTVRLDEQLRVRVNTVDTLEGLEGHAALVLTLSHLGDAPVGHYGRGLGAEALWPMAQ